MPEKTTICSDCGVAVARDATRCKPCAMTKRWADARARLPIPNPSGKCFCGCGGVTALAEATRLKQGYVRGEHVRWIMGHQSRREQRPDTGGALYVEEDRGHGSPCWIWQGDKSVQGYAHQRVGRRKERVHRLYFEHENGPIPEGLVLDHLCRQRECINPTHLEAVTIGDNFRRGMAPQAVAFRNGTCVAGHERTPENTHTREDGTRRCRVCRNVYKRANYASRPKPTKLDCSAVREIRRLLGTMRQSDIAARFGVSPTAVIDVKLGRTWKHCEA